MKSFNLENEALGFVARLETMRNGNAEKKPLGAVNNFAAASAVFFLFPIFTNSI